MPGLLVLEYFQSLKDKLNELSMMTSKIQISLLPVDLPRRKNIKLVSSFTIVLKESTCFLQSAIARGMQLWIKLL